MIKYLDVYKEKIISELNIVDDGRHWCNYIYNNYDDVKLWVKIIKKDINMCIKNEINSVNNRVIIVDSFMLPLLDIFDDCDLKINIKSDIDMKLIRLKERLKEVGRFHLFDDVALLNRIKYTAFNDYDEYYDYTVNNNKDIINLNDDCEKILVKKNNIWSLV